MVFSAGSPCCSYALQFFCCWELDILEGEGGRVFFLCRSRGMLSCCCFLFHVRRTWQCSRIGSEALPFRAPGSTFLSECLVFRARLSQWLFVHPGFLYVWSLGGWSVSMFSQLIPWYPLVSVSCRCICLSKQMPMSLCPRGHVSPWIELVCSLWVAQWIWKGYELEICANFWQKHRDGAPFISVHPEQKSKAPIFMC